MPKPLAPDDAEHDEQAEGGSLLDDILLADGDEAEEGDYELELDDFQAQEVRQIFFTTLPQYLQPIEEMLEQLFVSDQPPEDLCNALITTVASISAAGARLGIEAVQDPLQRMQDEISQLSQHVGPPPSRARDAIEDALSSLRDLTDAPPEAESARAQTIFAAFKDVEGVDRSVLEKLTAAGVVTVDQVRMAEPSEIAAVSGLDMAVVMRLVRALGGGRSTRASAESGKALDDQLRSRLRARVDAEAAVEEARVKLTRLRLTKAGLQRELSDARQQRDALRRELDVALERLQAATTGLADLRARLRRAELERIDATSALRLTRKQLAKLSQERKSALDTYTRCEQQVAGLRTRLARLREAAGPAEQSLPRRRGLRDRPDER